GPLRWASCSADGEERATLHVDAEDGVVAIDLRPAGSALPRLSLVETDTGWTGQQGDVTVTLTRPRANALELAVDLDSGCEVRATMTRPSVGIVACDLLAAWARIESQCTTLARPPLENAARLARQKATWRKARGAARDRLAQQCTARAAKVESEMVDVGCAPHPDPAIGLRGAECPALRTTASRLARCSNVPHDVRVALEREVVVLIAASQGADRAALPVV